jgi:hypothetical protein
MIQDHDSEIERRSHPENFEEYDPDKDLSAGGAVKKNQFGYLKPVIVRNAIKVK